MYAKLENPEDKHGEKELKRQLDKIPGVISVSLSTDHRRVAVDFDTTGTNTEQIRKRRDSLGLTVTNEQFEEHKM